jgi:phospholipid/cholesterol/gamma-HCH transport system permease protein
MSMSGADFQIDSTRTGGARLSLIGDWTASALGRTGQRLKDQLRGRPVSEVDISQLGRFDTTGAFMLLRATGGAAPADAFAARPEARQILDLVSHAEVRRPLPKPKPDAIQRTLEKIGHGVVHLGEEAYHGLAFNGHLLASAGRTLIDPRRIRWPAWVDLTERAGLDALPIVVVTNFFVGAVIAFLGAKELEQFGAQVFTVELIGISVLREFGVVITAVLLAGRSASSFAAEIGAMKMNQEVDAMQIMGVDAFDALVLPRLVALLLMTPLLTFMADAAGLFGGALVAWNKLGLGPVFFLQRIQENVGITHFWVGLSKAPVLAVVVTAIGCRQGLSVGGDVESLGRRVTSAVVQSIFAIIVIDAIFALIYMEANV